MSINVPNQITLGRLGLTLVFFALLSVYSVVDANTDFVLPWSFWIFLVASLTDWLDGYLARTLRQVTAFGRIVDPVVDKVMVCGAFVFFAGPGFLDIHATPYENAAGVAPWMVVVLLIREFAVSAIRSHSEAQGRDFGANWVGKLKMILQSTTVCVVLGQLAWFRDDPPWMASMRAAFVWATVLVTALSLLSYVHRARAFLLSKSALGGPAEPSNSADG